MREKERYVDNLEDSKKNKGWPVVLAPRGHNHAGVKSITAKSF